MELWTFFRWIAQKENPKIETGSKNEEAAQSAIDVAQQEGYNPISGTGSKS